MCGIVGYVGKKRVVPVIIEGLRRLEYRGYDSAGIAVCGNGDGLQIRRAEGKLRNLEEVIRLKPLDGTYGIGHTRWATHGRPSETNAHPHRAGDVVVVHNGIIENYLDLKEQLIRRGTKFSSETDTEIVAHLVAEKIDQGMDFLEAVRKSLKEIRGSYALLFLNQRDPKRLIVAKNSTPIVIGGGEGENFIASDIVAHNSIEQDSDIVMFIYRDDIYNQESERKNIADIIIAKHRNGPVGEISLYFQASQTRFRDLELNPPAE